MRYRYDPARTWGAAPRLWTRTPVIENPVSSRPVPRWRQADRHLSLPRTTSPVRSQQNRSFNDHGCAADGRPGSQRRRRAERRTETGTSACRRSGYGPGGSGFGPELGGKGAVAPTTTSLHPGSPGGVPPHGCSGGHPPRPLRRRRPAVAGFGLNDE